MKLFTYSDLETRVRKDLDLQDSDNFVGNDEMVTYFNEAIEDCESEIMSLNQDYFLKQGTITLVQGTASYSLPTDIYAQKIRALIYSNGPKIYPIQRIKELHEFYKYEETNYYASGETEYGYILRNDTAGSSSTLSLSPPAIESGAFVKIWYIRHSQRIPLIGEVVNGVTTTRAIQLAVVVDIPEWADYLVQFAKCRCYEKEMDPRLPQAVEALANRKKMMVESLSKQVIDNSDEVPMDLEFYMEHN